MTTTLKDLHDNPDVLKAPGPACCMCRQELAPQESRHQISEGVSCEDCYFERLGREIEQHAPGWAGVRR